MQITDTLKATRDLEQSGLPRAQAEALAQQQEQTAQRLVENIRLAFAPEFASIRAESSAQFAAVRADMKAMQAELGEALRDQLFKFTVMLFSGMGLTIAALSLVYALSRN